MCAVKGVSEDQYISFLSFSSEGLCVTVCPKLKFDHSCKFVFFFLVNSLHDFEVSVTLPT